LTSEKTHNLVLFDFDGTVYDGQSPVMLVTELYRSGFMHTRRALRILAWGVRYKTGLPHNETHVRELIFSSMRDYPAAEYDDFMRVVYQDRIRNNLRPEALACIAHHKEQGDTVAFISASFAPILEGALIDTGADAAETTTMEIIDGHYTGVIEGLAVEGEEKVRRVFRIAQRLFGDEPYRITYAYADHASDIPMMMLAEHPVAVSPSSHLRAVAEAKNWEIIDWH